MVKQAGANPQTQSAPEPGPDPFNDGNAVKPQKPLSLLSLNERLTALEEKIKG